MARSKAKTTKRKAKPSNKHPGLMKKPVAQAEQRRIWLGESGVYEETELQGYDGLVVALDNYNEFLFRTGYDH